MLKKIIKFFKAINSNKNPGEISHAVCLGMMLGFMPKSNALWYLLAIFYVFMRIHKGSFLLFTFLFSLLAPVLDPVFDTVGYWFLTIPALEPVFVWLINIPFVGFTKFNNTIVCGSLLISLAAYIPTYWICRLILKYWRATLAPVIRKTKLLIFLSKLPLIQKIGEMV